MPDPNPEIKIPDEFDGENTEGYMIGCLDDLGEMDIWLQDQGHKRVFQGFEITDSIDGGKNEKREVSLVVLKSAQEYPQHVHDNSDAFFVIIDGQAYFLSHDKRFLVSKGNRIKVPRGTPHGFDLEGDGIFSFVSIQSPPIRDHSGQEDFRLIDKI